MLVMFLALPTNIRWDIIKEIHLVVLLIYPITTVVYSVLLFLRYDRTTSDNLLVQYQRSYVVAVEEAPIPIVIHTDDGEVITINQTWFDLTGYTKEDIPTIKEWTTKAYPKDKHEKALRNVKNIYKSTKKVHEGEAHIKTKFGTTIVWDFYSSPLGTLPDGKKAVLSVATDVTQRKHLEKKLMHLSYHDELTGLYNRRFFEVELKRLNTKRNHPLTLLMGDVNGLKLINDSFGHLAGDELLKTTANIIKNACRQDDIISRLGGDEFIIILPNTSQKTTEDIVKRIKEDMKNHSIESIELSVSFGFSSITSELQEVENVFTEAENAMYQNKLFESPSIRGYAIDIILNTLFEIDPETKIHSERVSLCATRLAEAMGLSQLEIQEVKTAALLHDIGKIATPVSILNKEGKLTEEEMNEIKKHPEKGFRILCSGPNMENIAKYCLHHHERYDGKGYPNGLSKENIPLQSRIICLADAYDAMISERTYKKRLTKEETILEIKNNMGTQFDPELATIYIEKILAHLKE